MTRRQDISVSRIEMGYDIHITRRENWSATGEPEITLQEWQQVVASDPELEPLNVSSSKVQMCLRDQKGEPLAARYFYYVDGAVFVRKSNRSVLQKMLAIARQLNSHVVGDEDEIYSSDGVPDRNSTFPITDDW